MAETQHLLPLVPRLPSFPSNAPPELAPWAKGVEHAMRDLYIILANRLQDLITADVIANRPAANGTFRFYFATDTNALSFDDGTWNAI